MNSDKLIRALMIISIVSLLCVSTYVIVMTTHSNSKASSFVGYSQSCWQEGNVLHVVTAKGDTVRFDISRLEEK